MQYFYINRSFLNFKEISDTVLRNLADFCNEDYEKPRINGTFAALKQQLAEESYVELDNLEGFDLERHYKALDILLPYLISAELNYSDSDRNVWCCVLDEGDTELKFYESDCKACSEDTECEESDLGRIYLRDEDQREDAEQVLDECGIDFDYDSGNRLMISDYDMDEACEVLSDADIDFDVI